MDGEARIPYSRLATLVLLISLNVIGVGFSAYLIVSSHSLYMILIAAAFGILTLISGFFNITTSYLYYRSYLYDSYLAEIKKSFKPTVKFPTVAIAMPVYNEEPELAEKNISRLRDLDYPSDKLKFYILDDSTDREVRAKLEAFSKKNGIAYIHRKDRRGFKAGALNNLLNYCKEEFIAVFDYDEYLTDVKFLKETVPYFQDKDVSYVQTEKRYAKGTFFSDTVDLFDGFFFKFIQPARALNNTAIFAGSCGIIRTSHLKKIGGFPEYVVEDTFFSFESDSHGYKSLYVPKVYALGKPIKTFTELVRQQWRYNYGDNQFLLYFMKGKHKPVRRDFSTLSSIDYMTHGFGLNYISIILLMFTVVSIFLVFSEFQIAHLSLASILTGDNLNLDLEILGLSAFSLTVLTPVMLTKIHFKSMSKGFMIFILNFSLAFVRAKAALWAVLKKDYQVLWEGRRRLYERSLQYAVRNSSMEIAFSAALFALSGVALAIDNITGGLWLLWYGILYTSTFYMFYRYG